MNIITRVSLLAWDRYARKENGTNTVGCTSSAGLCIVTGSRPRAVSTQLSKRDGANNGEEHDVAIVPGKACQLVVTSTGVAFKLVAPTNQGAVMKSTPVKTLLTIGEVADHLRVSKSYLYKVAEQRELRHFKIGKRLMFRPADVESFVSSRLVEATG